MRSPKGFGKNYFTLAAIQATVSQTTLHSQTVVMRHALHVSFDEEDNVEEEPLKETLLSPLVTHSKASHCSCHCAHISRLIIKNQAISNCDIAQFLRTDSVSSPPYFS
ncbi:MAG: hypothetical protein U9R50_06665 [Campylobacterota bacterium]|nr:hypothetical protein [Campylobacterota bacterium]